MHYFFSFLVKSETSPSICFDVLILGGFSLEFVQVLSWVFKVQPWSLWSHIESTHWITCPAVEIAIEMVVWVGISIMLMPMKTL